MNLGYLIVKEKIHLLFILRFKLLIDLVIICVENLAKLACTAC